MDPRTEANLVLNALIDTLDEEGTGGFVPASFVQLAAETAGIGREVAMAILPIAVSTGLVTRTGDILTRGPRFTAIAAWKRQAMAAAEGRRP